MTHSLDLTNIIECDTVEHINIMKGETMNRYQLQAKLNGHIKTIWFQDINDIEAIYTGIFRTLDNASKSRIWQKGYIALTNLTTGELVKEMASKQ